MRHRRSDRNDRHASRSQRSYRHEFNDGGAEHHHRGEPQRLLVGDAVLEPIAVGEAILSEDEKELGSVLVDIGGGKTNVAIYHHGAVRQPSLFRSAASFSPAISRSDCAPAFPKRSASSVNKDARSRQWRRATKFRSLRRRIAPASRHRAALLTRHHPASRGRNRSPRQKRDPQRRLRTAGRRRRRIDRRRRHASRFRRTRRRHSGSAGAHRRFDRLLPNGRIRFVCGQRTKGNTPEMPQLKGPEFATIAGLVLYGDRRRKTHDFHENSGSGFKKLAAKFRSFL